MNPPTETSPPLKSTPFFSAIISALVACFWTTFGLSCIEGVWISVRTPKLSLVELPLVLSLFAPLGLGLGLLLGLITGGWRAIVPSDEKSLLRYLRRNSQWDQSVAAGLISFATCLVLEILLVDLFNQRVASGMANSRLAALSTALVASGGMLLGGVIFLPLLFFWRGATRLIRRFATIWILGGGAVAVGGAGVIILGGLDWRVLHLGPWIALLILGASLVIATWRYGLRDRGRQASVRAVIMALAAGLSLSASAPLWGRSAWAAESVAEKGVLSPLLLSIARGLGDRDGDGYSAWFGGGDCDDGNPAVHPGAKDIPGNGIDENCEGGDARAQTKPTPVLHHRENTPRFEGNLLLVCIDTLRADKLGVLGHKGGLTPHLDALAERGVLFTQAVAQGPNTPQSFPSFFTSLYPSRVPFMDSFTGYPRLKPEALTFFEVLHQAGIRTAAVTSHFYFTEERGITQGVKDWDNREAKSLKDSNKDIASPRIVPRAIDKLKELGASNTRFALFVHLFEPHSTYVTHSGFPISERGVKGLEQKYDFEIKFSDLWLGKLLEGLKAAGLEERTAVIVFGDHAEAFGEHHFYFHGQSLYHEVLHVPLILYLPRGPKRVIKERVALLDLAPTIIDLMGAKVPESFVGISLLPYVHGAHVPEDRSIGAVLMPYPAWPKGQQALYKGRYKSMFRVTENRFEAYDLAKDPAEQKNLAETNPDLARQLRQDLSRFAEGELQ